MSGHGASRLADVASETAPAHSLTGAASMLAFAAAVVVTTEFIVVGLLPEMARDLGISAAGAGWFVTWFAAASALCGPPLTVVAGRFSPRATLSATLLIFALGNLAVVLGPTRGVVVATRVVQGTALPVLVSVGSAAVATIAGPGRQGRAVSARPQRARLPTGWTLAWTYWTSESGLLVASRFKPAARALPAGR